MATVKPFKCVRPAADKVSQIAALPYDVYNRAEAKAVVEKNHDSFLAIDRAETLFPDDVDTYDERVYQRAAQLLQEWIENGNYIRDDRERYYIYELTMDGRAQTGIVACASIDDYENAVIKKHENTRAEKELDRIRHVDALSAQTGPIFLAYRANEIIRDVVLRTKADCALYDFTADDGIRHRIWAVADSDTAAIFRAFEQINEIYIADGHHRAASAVKVGLKRRAEHPDYSGSEEFNFFLSVLFPDEELLIMDYNRVVKDLNGLSEAEFLERLCGLFEVKKIENLPPEEEEDAYNTAVRPTEKGMFSVYSGGEWYSCRMRKADVPDDPVLGLDVSVLQNRFLSPVLGIEDPKTDNRIDFVGGIRGMAELKRRADTDCRAAFAMYPTSISELFDVADANRLMPPKSTWFEPKLRSGIFIHEI